MKKKRLVQILAIVLSLLLAGGAVVSAVISAAWAEAEPPARDACEMSIVVYEEEQALLFVKIKNLQQADFTIEEIKSLLPGDDDLLMAAFERKIREQKQKLATIQKIQRSYLKEAMDMRNMVNEYLNFVEGRMAK